VTGALLNASPETSVPGESLYFLYKKKGKYSVIGREREREMSLVLPLASRG